MIKVDIWSISIFGNKDDKSVFSMFLVGLGMVSVVDTKLQRMEDLADVRRFKLGMS